MSINPNRDNLVDLHFHSTCSDGTYTPKEVALMCSDAGLKAAALTDHDNFHGWPEFSAACDHLGVEAIPGVEISALWTEAPGRPRTLDILAYFFDPENEEFSAKLDWMLRVRRDRNGMILEKLAELGMPVDRERVNEFAGSDVVGRPHIAKAMLEKGYAETMQEIFDRYLGDNKAAWVPKARLLPHEAIELINNAGGRAVVAHPYVLPLNSAKEYRNLLAPLKEVGLAGLEVEYPQHSPEQKRMFKALTDELGLIATGGSDFHGEARPGVSIGTGLGDLRVPYSVVEELRAAESAPSTA